MILARLLHKSLRTPLSTVWVLLVLSAISTVTLSAQTSIGGIINNYYAVAAVSDCDSTVVITDPQGLYVGDRVLVMQMKGASINESNDATFGDLVSIAAAGCLEYMTVKSIRGTTVEFDSKFVHQYQSEHKVQMVRVPRYADAIVTSELRAQPWDGTTGGVIALDVDGSLTLNANINADSMGFRGGLQGGILKKGCDFPDWNSGYAAGMAGAKGESIVNVDNLAARGKLLAGGGGGNGNNAGGGGGGNGGAGGIGGDASPYCNITKVGGAGGTTLVEHVPLQRMFFGSGGGGGHENRTDQGHISFQATAGVSGGGLVLVRASIITSNGYNISANGADVVEISGWDAAGGGGAGGTVYVEANMINGMLVVQARGGNGGDVGYWSGGIVYQAAGPGGGGGGGVVILPKTQMNIVPDVTAGRSGTHIEQQSTHYLDPRGAMAGSPGVVLTEFTWGTPKRYELEAGGDATICPVGTASLWAKPGFVAYRWSNGDTTITTTINTHGTYWVEAVDSLGCTHRVENINVVVDPSKFEMDTAVDFGSCDLNVLYTRTVQFTNSDDEPTVINSIGVATPFMIVSPTLPAVVAPGATVDIVVALVAVVEGELEDTLRLSIQSPCTDSGFAVLRSRVNPVYSNFVVGSTIAHVGDVGVKVPVTMQMLQDSAHLDDVTIRFDLTMDSRAFAPSKLTRGRRLRDLIDFENNLRTLTIEIDSVFIRHDEEVLTVLEGTILNSGLTTVPVKITDLKWVVASRDPITTIQDGEITVLGGCAADSRIVKFVDLPAAHLHPNPASDNVTIDVEMTMRGEYVVSIFDVEGRVLFKYADMHIEDVPRMVPLSIPVDQWESGSYVVMFNSPSRSQAFPLAVVK